MIAGGMSVNDLLNITDKVEVAFRELLQCGLLNRMPQSDYSVIYQEMTGNVFWYWHMNRR